MQETTIAALIEAHPKGAVVVDVRETEEYVDGHVPGAIHIPLSQLSARTEEVPKSEPVFVICRSGQRSKVGSDVLEAHGYQAASVAGGTLEWIRAGKPVVTGTERG